MSSGRRAESPIGLLQELQSASLCISDITDARPNVMWETGYAMALGIPTLLITQDMSALPFDLKDMQCLKYNRRRLKETLGRPMSQLILDTIGASGSAAEHRRSPPPSVERDPAVGTLLEQMQELKSMLADAVRTWSPERSLVGAQPEGLSGLVGPWFNRSSASRCYARMVEGDLVVPYCFGGDETCTAFYYGWRRAGDHWFARFIWMEAQIAGFTFLRQVSTDRLVGAWWGHDSTHLPDAPDRPPHYAGEPVVWERLPAANEPPWVEHFFETYLPDLAERLRRRL